MKKFYSISLGIVILSLVGCINLTQEQAKEILENRKVHVQEIKDATNECLINSKNASHLEETDNESTEVLRTCIKYGQKLYGAYSEYDDSLVYKTANGMQ